MEPAEAESHNRRYKGAVLRHRYRAGERKKGHGEAVAKVTGRAPGLKEEKLFFVDREMTDKFGSQVAKGC
ncbi:NACHT, LRR and PYD domains-containing protein 12-like isoform X5 [Anopheles sinensis]|uniref:NACHT, LRR and PYD domains-containing protein 12-like isoform X5 n=1 Tax=Anopheles sinensis TaxID=74873 RepID=A0A084VNT3_ANOSI|nr:NACHT, LRR and PYD domains-containing protein 12-like isoform X5 [Anopheles sinensis]